MVVQTRSSAVHGDGTDASPCSVATTKSRKLKRNRRAEAARGDGNSLPTSATLPATNGCHDISNFISQPQSPTQPHQEEEEPMEKFLVALAKNTLVVLVKEAVSKYDDPDYIRSIRKVADVDPALRKIQVEFCGKGRFDDETLTSIFGKYGEIKDYCFVDRARGNPFWPFPVTVANILFKHRYGARKVLRLPQISIGEGNAVTTKLHSLIGDLSALSFSPGFRFRGFHKSLLEVEEPGEKLIDFFGKDYLVGLVMEAISKHPDFVGSVEKQASLDSTPRRIMVIGQNLPYSFGTLTSFYSKYGEIEECNGTAEVANIVFKHRSSALKALKEHLRPWNGMYFEAFCRPGPDQIDIPVWKSTGDSWSWIPDSEITAMQDAVVASRMGCILTHAACATD